jgi:hypothetical protein
MHSLTGKRCSILHGSLPITFGKPRYLDSQARRLEGVAKGPPLESLVAGEREVSPATDGRPVFGWEADLSVGKSAGSSDKSD